MSRSRISRAPAIGPDRLDGRSGFTLLEVLIAFAIVAMAMGATLQAFSTGLRGLRTSEAREIALLHAQSKLEEIGITIPLAPGERTGHFDNGSRWTSRIAPQRITGDHRDAAAVIAYVVEVGVAWSESGTERTVMLRTVRVGPEPP